MFDELRPLTMVPRVSLIDLARQARAVLAYDIPGALVECGVWRGGASLLLAEVLRRAKVTNRTVWMCDSFEGLPTPHDVDGSTAKGWSAAHPELDNLRVSLAQVTQTVTDFGLTSYIKFVKGWFNETLPRHRALIGPIALLRIDCDWHSSVTACLEGLFDLVSPGGFVVLDDYYSWSGAAIALHEFLGKRQLPLAIESVYDRTAGYGAFPTAAVFRNGGTRWHESWTAVHEILRATHEVASVVPAGHTFILVDQDAWRTQCGQRDLVVDRRAMPFLEHAGEYGGPPAHDAVAIAEFERLRADGATFAVFAWPAFWWLDHYTKLRQHLETTYQQLLATERVVVFDLRCPPATAGRGPRSAPTRSSIL
jgi:O-methyltransferase